jgi:hypothetical protein
MRTHTGATSAAIRVNTNSEHSAESCPPPPPGRHLPTRLFGHLRPPRSYLARKLFSRVSNHAGTDYDTEARPWSPQDKLRSCQGDGSSCLEPLLHRSCNTHTGSVRLMRLMSEAYVLIDAHLEQAYVLHSFTGNIIILAGLQASG